MKSFRVDDVVLINQNTQWSNHAGADVDSDVSISRICMLGGFMREQCSLPQRVLQSRQMQEFEQPALQGL